MKIYKIAQESPFYEWFSNELLRITNNYKEKIPKHLNNDIINEIAAEFKDLSKEELGRLNIVDLYIINYIRTGYGTLGALKDRTFVERLSGVKKEWLIGAVTKFPDILNKYITPSIAQNVEKSYISYTEIPDEYKALIPKSTKAKVVDYYSNAILNNWASYRDVPEDLKPMLPRQTRNYIVDQFAEAFKDASDNALEMIPGDIRDEVDQILESNKRIRENV